MSSSFRAHAKKDKIKWIVSFILIAVVLLGVIGLGVKVFTSEKTKDTSLFAYSVGALNTTTGEEEDSVASIRMKEFVKTDGLTVNLHDDATVEYKIFFYDEAKEFIFATDLLDEDYDFATDGTALTSAKFAKVVVYPTTDSDITWLESLVFVSQLTVTVNK